MAFRIGDQLFVRVQLWRESAEKRRDGGRCQPCQEIDIVGGTGGAVDAPGQRSRYQVFDARCLESSRQ